MNLFYDPSIIGLRQLIDTSDKSLPTHNIVLDFDGEVIIDPETKYSGIHLNRFKFQTQISQRFKNDARALRSLFETLLAAYNDNGHRIELHGNIKRVA